MVVAATVPTNGLLGWEGVGELEISAGKLHIAQNGWAGVEKENTPVLSHTLNATVTNME